MYLDAGREQQELQAEGSGEEDGAPCEGHAGGGLLPGGSRGSVIVGATLRSGFIPLRVGHARAETELRLLFPKKSPQSPDRAVPSGPLPAREPFVCYCPGSLLPLHAARTQTDCSGSADNTITSPGGGWVISTTAGRGLRAPRPLLNINKHGFVYSQFTWRCRSAFTHGG